MKRFCSIVAAALAVITLVLCLGACSLVENMLNTGNRQGLDFSLMPDDTYSVSVGNATEYTNIVIPATYKGKAVTAIDAYGFAGSAIESIVIPSNVTRIYHGAFEYCTSLASVTIPDSVTSIGEYAFYNCDSLTSITIPDSVTSIGEYAFYNCDSLTSVTIGDSVKGIGEYAFYDCDSLTSIVIPDSVTSIGNYAFAHCNSLTIYCEAESKPSGWDSFWKSSNCPVVWGYKAEN